MEKNKRIYIAGHTGMVGSAIWRALENKGYLNLIGRTRKELDLMNQSMVLNFIKKEKPEVVILAAARVGGILANNNYPYQFLMENLQIQNNLIESSLKFDVEKFIFLGSSCIYPKFATQPLKEEYLLTGSLETTNEYYALAKIAGLKACQAIKNQFGKDYFSLMPTNLYGYFDNFDIQTSHVLPALIRKFHKAKMNGDSSVVLWGTGAPMREFLFVDDMANAVVFALENKMSKHFYNVGSGKEISIKDLSTLVQKITDYKGEVVWDASKPDGTPRKVLDVSMMTELGWQYSVELEEGVSKTYNWFLNNIESIKELKF